jgi:hypothetical protein
MKNFKLFVELSDEEARKVRELGAARGPVLDHLFRGKDRVFFPLPPDPHLYTLKKVLEKIPHPRHPDTPKYRIGMNDLRNGQVRMLSKGKHPEKGEYINDKNVTTITKVLGNERSNPDIQDGNFEMVWNDIQPYWVVVSRHPIDVKRMADFPNLQSCHSFGSSHYHCTDEEVESGGAVAFLINASDFSKVNQSDDEIFADKGFTGSGPAKRNMPGRNLEGVVPVARTRIRRAEHTGTQEEIGVVEDAVYGIEESGHLSERFRKALRQWVTSKQPGKSADAGTYELRGGDYEDSSVSNMYRRQYERNPAYLNRLLTKIQKLEDEEDILRELSAFTGSRPAMVMRLGGRRLWVSEVHPTTPYDLFRSSWIANYLSSDSSRFIDQYRVMHLLENVEAINQFEKYIINTMNRNSDAKVVKVGSRGWTVVVPVAAWIMESGAANRRVNRTMGKGDVHINKLMSNLNKAEMKRKFYSLFQRDMPKNNKTGPLEVGEIVYHPQNGRGVVTQITAPGSSVQVQWVKDKTYDFVPLTRLHRDKDDAKAAKQQIPDRTQPQLDKLPWRMMGWDQLDQL